MAEIMKLVQKYQLKSSKKFFTLAVKLFGSCHHKAKINPLLLYWKLSNLLLTLQEMYEATSISPSFARSSFTTQLRQHKSCCYLIFVQRSHDKFFSNCFQQRKTLLMEQSSFAWNFIFFLNFVGFLLFKRWSLKIKSNLKFFHLYAKLEDLKGGSGTLLENLRTREAEN